MTSEDGEQSKIRNTEFTRTGATGGFRPSRCLAGILPDGGFRNVDLKLRQNAFHNCSHRRLMGRAEADPAKSDPAGQKHEHDVMTKEDVTSQKHPASRRDRVLSRLPQGLHPAAKRMRRFVRRLVG